VTASFQVTNLSPSTVQKGGMVTQKHHALVDVLEFQHGASVQSKFLMWNCYDVVTMATSHSVPS